jgi:hypothetical protein
MTKPGPKDINASGAAFERLMARQPADAPMYRPIGNVVAEVRCAARGHVAGTIYRVPEGFLYVAHTMTGFPPKMLSEAKEMGDVDTRFWNPAPILLHPDFVDTRAYGRRDFTCRCGALERPGVLALLAAAHRGEARRRPDVITVGMLGSGRP